jgi:hypothetical protein
VAGIAIGSVAGLSIGLVGGLQIRSDLRPVKVSSQAAIDIPQGIWQTRNRLVHPPEKQSQEWPNRDVMQDAWRIELEILELIILRLVGYDGNYGHRRHLKGRWIGDTMPVPWAT